MQVNGHDHNIEIGIELVKIRLGLERHTDILLAAIEQGRRTELEQREILATLWHLPGQITSMLPSAPPTRARTLNLKTVLAILQALPPVLFLAALIAAKAAGLLTWAEVVDRVRFVTGG